MDRRKYAIEAVAFLINSLPDALFQKVNQVILFGSVATGTAGQESDVDVFIDADMKATEIGLAKRMIRKSVQEFATSSNGLKFKLAGIDNPMSVRVGNLDEWQDLRESIESSGVMLYGPYMPARKLSKRYMIIYWEKLGIPNRGALLNKLYGYSIGKRYPGLLEKIGGRRIGKSAILVPAHRKNEVMSVLERYGVGYKVAEI